ncbi:LOW QUALITY PROTEIN: hypothetical protein PanWU01x14_072630 [Parasponia andersonii]|uniref:Uncharacterized protein n=1 Tax=Parasponia andersonii TaxID=3476 RepID=A0A2P5DDU5_PARAD|nr:LOW QUALITY PROTEIN: hypothetical protein PanWU01x14_072630 [Parasponia andersonii]
MMMEFKHNIEKLDHIHRGIPYLEEVGFSKWPRVYSTNKRYTFMTSNIVESMNVANNAARHLLVTLLVECLRSFTQNWA